MQMVLVRSRLELSESVFGVAETYLKIWPITPIFSFSFQAFIQNLALFFTSFFKVSFSLSCDEFFSSYCYLSLGYSP